MAWTKILLSGDAATTLTGTAYRLLIVNSGGAVAELVYGDSGKVLTSGGASANPTWETPSGGAHALDAGQTDVTITSPAEDNLLAYNFGTSTWINQTAAEAGLAVASHGVHVVADGIGAAEINDTATDIAFKQIILTPTTTGTGTTEGTLMYDSDDNHLYVYVV